MLNIYFRLWSLQSAFFARLPRRVFLELLRVAAVLLVSAFFMLFANVWASPPPLLNRHILALVLVLSLYLWTWLRSSRNGRS